MKFNYQLRRVCGSYYGRPLETSASSSGGGGNGGSVSTQWSGSNILFYNDVVVVAAGGGGGITTSKSSSSSAATSSSSTTTTTTYLISAVLNRIQIIDLQSIHVRTVPIEARSNIVYMAISSSSSSTTAPLLVTIDTQGHVMLIHIIRNIVLHRWTLSSSSSSSAAATTTTCIPQFSPMTGRYIAFGVGTHVQVWNIPSIRTSSGGSGGSGSNSNHNSNHNHNNIHEFCPMILHRTYTGCTQSITHLEWSRDETILMAASSDGSIRLYTLHNHSNNNNNNNHYHYKSYQPISLLGHKSSIVSVYFNNNDNMDNGIYSISMDGAVVVWTGIQQQLVDTLVANNEIIIDTPPIEEEEQEEEDDTNDIDAAVNFFTGNDNSTAMIATAKRQKRDDENDNGSHRRTAADILVNTSKYTVTDRMYLQQECTNGTVVTCTSYCPNNSTGSSSSSSSSNGGIMAIGFSSGVFGIYEMPNCVNIHTLSVGTNQKIQTCMLLQPSGSWLALGCPISQQLLVWEWQSETYILKQRGHAYGMSCMAYSQDSICIATGGEDGKIKLWNSRTGFCYVTFPSESSHTAAITGITFANDSVIITCSLDGTVKAHDLYRYRTFKTYTSPTPVQFLSLAVDSNGEIVVAGSNDPFHIYVWNIQTAQLLDIFTGHTGPICDLQFLSGVGILVSGSWDGTVKTWDIYKGNTNTTTTESFQHTTDVICIAVSPNKKQVCSSTMNGLLSFWDIEDHKLLYEIDGRYDISGGRKLQHRRTADTNMSSKYFTSVTYTPDNTCIIAGGNSKYICIYEISQQILLKKFQLSYNRSIDGILDELNSKNLKDGGPLPPSTNDSSIDATTYNASTLPGAKRGDDGSMNTKGVEVRTIQIVFANTGREWGVISEEGLHIYSLDDDMIFDPLSMTEQEVITPATIEHKLSLQEYSAALRMALYLNEYHIIQSVLEQIPYGSIEFVCRSIYHDTNANKNKRKHSISHHQPLEILLQVISTMIEESPHIEFYIQWSLTLLQLNGFMIECNRSIYLRVLRALHKAIITKRTDFYAICNDNKYMLEFIENHALLMQQIKIEEEAEEKTQCDAKIQSGTYVA